MLDVEALVMAEFMDKEGVSAGAAARQVCRSLPPESPLRSMLEAMLATANRRSLDRSMILDEFREFNEKAGTLATIRSFRRINNI